MSDYAGRHPTDVVEQLRIRYEAIALVADVIRAIDEYRIEHGQEAETTPALHLADVDTPPGVLAAIHEFNYQLLDAERSIGAWFEKHSGAVLVPTDDAEHERPTTARARERTGEGCRHILR